MEILSIKNFVVDGFRIVGNVAKAGDEGPVKITGGPTIYNDSGNLHFINNTFAGTGVDGIKVIKTSGVHVVGNTFNGNFTQQILDFVTVSDSTVQGNLVMGRGSNGLTMKSGSTNFDVIGNHFNFTATSGQGPAILVGGEGFSFSSLPPEISGFEARNILVKHNVIQNSGTFAIHLQGAKNSTITENFFGNNGDEAIRAKYSHSAYGWSDNSGNKITSNILANGLDLYEVQPGAYLGSTVSGNRTGTLSQANFKYGLSAADLDSPSPTPTPPAPTPPPATGGVTLDVKVGGNGTDAAPAKFKVFADGVLLGERSAKATTQKFNVNDDSLFDTFSFKLSKKPGEVDIVFINDGTTGGVDRNLFVDWISVGGTRHEAEIAGDYTPNNLSVPFETHTERMYWNGTMTFDL